MLKQEVDVSQNEKENQQKTPVLAYGRGREGFFTIHRRGQGKWTRLGTAGAAALIIVGMSLFIYNDVRANLGWTEITALIVAGTFILVSSLATFWVMNRPKNVTFLIDTDSEMKKVNWTSRAELIGSTKVVIGFMFILAAMLFAVDIIFGYLFYGIGVLKFSPGLFEPLFKSLFK